MQRMKVVPRVPLLGGLVGLFRRKKRRPTAEELMAMDRSEFLAFLRAIGLEASIERALREADKGTAS